MKDSRQAMREAGFFWIQNRSGRIQNSHRIKTDILLYSGEIREGSRQNPEVIQTEAREDPEAL